MTDEQLEEVERFWREVDGPEVVVEIAREHVRVLCKALREERARKTEEAVEARLKAREATR